MTRRIDKPDTSADIELRGYLDAETRPCFVMVAGAGSGKTTSLLKCLDHIGKKYGTELRRRGQQVACITYTEVAVGEIFADLDQQPLFHVSTIHSFLWTIIKPFQRDIGQWVRLRIKAKVLELQNKASEKRIQQKTKDKNAREIAKLQELLANFDKIQHFTYESGRDHSKGILGHDDIIKMVPELIQKHSLLATIVAQKYPFIFVDESQDTFGDFVDALRTISRQMVGKFCVGFFGDPMQKIYLTGVGDIELDDGWKKITKPENFRCPTAVLTVINKIRERADGLQQTRGRHQFLNDEFHPVCGTVQAFIVPADNQRSQTLERVRSILAAKYAEPHWTSNEPETGVRILVIAHRMAAAQLGFAELFAAFNEKTSESLRTSFREGTAWALKPFLDALLPMVVAFDTGRSFELMALLRTHSPRLNGEPLKRVDKVAGLLADLKNSVKMMADLISDSSNATLYDVLKLAHETQLVSLDERIKYYVNMTNEELKEWTDSVPAVSPADQGEEKKDDAAIAAALRCPAKQIRGYCAYINDDSPYSTQQGIKGAEFQRVLVVIDDEEGKHVQFSYDKLFGLTALSRQDNDNKSQSKETVVDRTLRLFYVCCSRAMKDLAVVWYSSDVAEAHEQLKESGIFDPAEIYTFEQPVVHTAAFAKNLAQETQL